MSRAVLGLSTFNTLNTFRRLPPELRSIALLAYTHTRSYATTTSTANSGRKHSNVKILRLEGAKKQKEAPSPLSPLSNPSSLRATRGVARAKSSSRPSTAVDTTESSTKRKARWEQGRNGASTRPRSASTSGPKPSAAPKQFKRSQPSETPTPSSPRKSRERRNNKAVSAPAKPSKGVDGVSTSRTLLVQPATDRASRVPIWARPASANLEKERRIAPDGLTWSEHVRKLRSKYGTWDPQKKLSRDAMEGLRMLHQTDPQKYPLWVLAQRFRISPEAVRRILKSKWRLGPQEREAKIVKERKRRAERMQMMRETEMHQMVMAGIKLTVHPDDKLQLR